MQRSSVFEKSIPPHFGDTARVEAPPAFISRQRIAARLYYFLRYIGSRLLTPKPFVISFIFHHIFRDEAEIRQNHLQPLQRTTVSQLRMFISYFKGQGYHFISPETLLEGSLPGTRNILLTFDDGYFNSLRALPVMEAYNVPATFFISTGNMLRREGFWWDTLHRERSRRGTPPSEIAREEHVLHTLPMEEIRRRLEKAFGRGVLRQTSDLSRPLLPAELTHIASHRLVTIGNHTHDHLKLDRVTEEIAADQITACQEIIRDLTGQLPLVVSFPHGNYNQSVLSVAGRAGLAMGITTTPRCNYLPLNLEPNGMAMLGRFGFFSPLNAPEELNRFRPDLPTHYRFHHN